MKFDPNQWREVPVNETFQTSIGRVQLRCSSPVTCWASDAESQEDGVPLEIGTKIDFQTAGLIAVHLKAVKGTRAFLYCPDPSAMQSTGEILTNVDRKPDESGSMAEVRQAVRRLELQQQSALSRMRQKMKIAQSGREENENQDELPLEPAEPAEPAPVPEPSEA